MNEHGKEKSIWENYIKDHIFSRPKKLGCADT